MRGSVGPSDDAGVEADGTPAKRVKRVSGGIMGRTSSVEGRVERTSERDLLLEHRASNDDGGGDGAI